MGDKMRQFASILFIFLLCGCVSSTGRLGYGYRIVHHTEDMRGAAGQFEGVIDCKDLYYQQQRLGTVDYYSISPSGRFALFWGGDTNKLMLFDQQTSKVREVADPYEIPRSSTWREAVGVVDVYYLEEDATKHITLQR